MENNNESKKVVINNKKSAAQFVRENGGSLDFVKNPHTGNIFFSCGTKKGYVSKKVLAVMDTVKLEDMGYGEIPYVDKNTGEHKVAPTLFLISKVNIQKHFEL